MNALGVCLVSFYFWRCSMNPSLKDQLQKWKRQHQVHTPEKPQKRQTDELTENDIKELMGMNRPTYRRYRGAYRQR